MRVQFSSIFFLNGLLVSIALLPLVRPSSHWFEALLAAVLGAFYLHTKLWWHVPSVRRTLWVSLTIISLTFAAAVLAAPSGSWLYVTQLTFVVLALPLTAFCIYRYGLALIALCFLGTLLLQAQWGVAQFAVQHDLGMRLIGESVLSPTQTAVAKFAAADSVLMRSYGPYAHANTFGGAMLIGLSILAWLAHRKFLFAYQVFFRAGWLLMLLGLLLSFSRAAYLGVVILLVLAMFVFRVRLREVSFISFIVILALLPLLYARFTDKGDQAVSERVHGYEWWGKIMQQQPWWQGVGPGQYPFHLAQYLANRKIKHHSWEIAPVHSAPLLILAEWGLLASLLGFGLALWLLRGGTWLIPLLPALLLDHYFITQAAPLLLLLMFWLMVTPRLPERAGVPPQY